MKKILDWYRSQSDTSKAFIWLSLICVIGVILRWEYVVEMISNGFSHYSK
ncbi:MAG: hypothetical protein KBS73_03045 [Bacteroidales bacterium]|nr:hypothetical protein [Candidatus Cacconaster equifaecalis]